MIKKYLYISTIGCQMNVYDSDRIAAGLAPLGYHLTPSVETADAVILNTCSIREKAEHKVYSLLGRLAQLKQKKPDLIVGVGGCVAQQEGEAIIARAPFVDVVFGTRAVHRLPDIIGRIEKTKCRIVDIDMTSDAADFELIPHVRSNSEPARFVTIMQGCDNFCAYCVVPYVRGRERSRASGAVIREIQSLVDAGVREVTLLGQNVNSYGKNEGWETFAELLNQINQISGLYRIRFTTSHPKDLSEELIAAFGRLEKLCRHIHLPVQSGSDAILHKMNRKYTRDMYLEKADRLRQVCPEIAISSDIIVGFPGETDEDFMQTLDLMRQMEYDSLFAFKYSDRPNAPAARLPDKTPDDVKSDRLTALLSHQESFTMKKNAAFVGHIETILVEGLSKKQGELNSSGSKTISWTGRTNDNKVVNFTCPDIRHSILFGQLVSVKIVDAFSHSLRGVAQT